jgi:hypothetical protein
MKISGLQPPDKPADPFGLLNTGDPARSWGSGWLVTPHEHCCHTRAEAHKRIMNFSPGFIPFLIETCGKEFYNYFFIYHTVTCRPIARERLINKRATNTNNRVDLFLGNAYNTRTQQWNQCHKRCFLCGSHISIAGQRMCFLCCGPTQVYITRSQQ